MVNPKKEYSRLYNKYVAKIYRFIFLKVSSQEMAEDITSIVFVRGWDKFRHQYSDSEQKTVIKNPPAYLYQIARNELASYYQKKNKIKTVQIDDSREIEDKSPGIREKITLSSDLQEIKKAINSLKEDYQNVIIWRYLDEYSIRDIAKITEKPAGTVRVMIHRALKELKSILKA